METARINFENHEASLTSWDACVAELKRSFTNQNRRQRAEDVLQAWTQGPNENVTSFVEDVLRLSIRADRQAIEEKKLRVLIKGVKSDIFGGLVRNPLTAVEGFVAEATNIERALSARAGHCNRFADSPAVWTFASPRIDLDGVGVDNLWEIIRDVVREELRKLVPAADRPASLSIVEVEREEVQQALRPEAIVNVATLEEPTLSYTAIARRPAPSARL